MEEYLEQGPDKKRSIKRKVIKKKKDGVDEKKKSLEVQDGSSSTVDNDESTSKIVKKEFDIETSFKPIATASDSIDSIGYNESLNTVTNEEESKSSIQDEYNVADDNHVIDQSNTTEFVGINYEENREQLGMPLSSPFEQDSHVESCRDEDGKTFQKEELSSIKVTESSLTDAGENSLILSKEAESEFVDVNVHSESKEAGDSIQATTVIVKEHEDEVSEICTMDSLEPIIDNQLPSEKSRPEQDGCDKVAEHYIDTTSVNQAYPDEIQKEDEKSGQELVDMYAAVADHASTESSTIVIADTIHDVEQIVSEMPIAIRVEGDISPRDVNTALIRDNEYEILQNEESIKVDESFAIDTTGKSDESQQVISATAQNKDSHTLEHVETPSVLGHNVTEQSNSTFSDDLHPRLENRDTSEIVPDEDNANETAKTLVEKEEKDDGSLSTTDKFSRKSKKVVKKIKKPAEDVNKEDMSVIDSQSETIKKKSIKRKIIKKKEGEKVEEQQPIPDVGSLDSSTDHQKGTDSSTATREDVGTVSSTVEQYNDRKESEIDIRTVVEAVESDIYTTSAKESAVDEIPELPISSMEERIVTTMTEKMREDESVAKTKISRKSKKVVKKTRKPEGDIKMEEYLEQEPDKKRSIKRKVIKKKKAEGEDEKEKSLKVQDGSSLTVDNDESKSSIVEKKFDIEISSKSFMTSAGAIIDSIGINESSNQATKGEHLSSPMQEDCNVADVSVQSSRTGLTGTNHEENQKELDMLVPSQVEQDTHIQDVNIVSFRDEDEKEFHNEEDKLEVSTASRSTNVHVETEHYQEENSRKETEMREDETFHVAEKLKLEDISTTSAEYFLPASTMDENALLTTEFAIDVSEKIDVLPSPLGISSQEIAELSPQIGRDEGKLTMIFESQHSSVSEYYSAVDDDLGISNISVRGPQSDLNTESRIKNLKTPAEMDAVSSHLETSPETFSTELNDIQEPGMNLNSLSVSQNNTAQPGSFDEISEVLRDEKESETQPEISQAFSTEHNSLQGFEPFLTEETFEDATDLIQSELAKVVELSTAPNKELLADESSTKTTRKFNRKSKKVTKKIRTTPGDIKPEDEVESQEQTFGKKKSIKRKVIRKKRVEMSDEVSLLSGDPVVDMPIIDDGVLKSDATGEKYDMDTSRNDIFADAQTFESEVHGTQHDIENDVASTMQVHESYFSTDFDDFIDKEITIRESIETTSPPDFTKGDHDESQLSPKITSVSEVTSELEIDSESHLPDKYIASLATDDISHVQEIAHDRGNEIKSDNKDEVEESVVFAEEPSNITVSRHSFEAPEDKNESDDLTLSGLWNRFKSAFNPSSSETSSSEEESKLQTIQPMDSSESPVRIVRDNDRDAIDGTESAENISQSVGNQKSSPVMKRIRAKGKKIVKKAGTSTNENEKKQNVGLAKKKSIKRKVKRGREIPASNEDEYLLPMEQNELAKPIVAQDNKAEAETVQENMEFLPSISTLNPELEAGPNLSNVDNISVEPPDPITKATFPPDDTSVSSENILNEVDPPEFSTIDTILPYDNPLSPISEEDFSPTADDILRTDHPHVLDIEHELGTERKLEAFSDFTSASSSSVPLGSDADVQEGSSVNRNASETKSSHENDGGELNSNEESVSSISKEMDVEFLNRLKSISEREKNESSTLKSENWNGPVLETDSQDIVADLDNERLSTKDLEHPGGETLGLKIIGKRSVKIKRKKVINDANNMEAMDTPPPNHGKKKSIKRKIVKKKQEPESNSDKGNNHGANETTENLDDQMETENEISFPSVIGATTHGVLGDEFSDSLTFENEMDGGTKDKNGASMQHIFSEIDKSENIADSLQPAMSIDNNFTESSAKVSLETVEKSVEESFISENISAEIESTTSGNTIVRKSRSTIEKKVETSSDSLLDGQTQKPPKKISVKRKVVKKKRDMDKKSEDTSDVIVEAVEEGENESSTMLNPDKVIETMDKPVQSGSSAVDELMKHNTVETANTAEATEATVEGMILDADMKTEPMGVSVELSHEEVETAFAVTSVAETNQSQDESKIDQPDQPISSIALEVANSTVTGVEALESEVILEEHYSQGGDGEQSTKVGKKVTRKTLIKKQTVGSHTGESSGKKRVVRKSMKSPKEESPIQSEESSMLQNEQSSVDTNISKSPRKRVVRKKNVKK